MSKSDPLDNLGPIWYHSDTLEVPYSPNQYLDSDFFATSYSNAALEANFEYGPHIKSAFAAINSRGSFLSTRLGLWRFLYHS